MRNTIAGQIAARARVSPDALAASGGGAPLTYGALERGATRLANWLRSRGVGPESTVALLLEPSPDLVMAALAVWKAGGAYVWPDPSLAPDQTGDILEDSGARAVISHRGLAVGIGVPAAHLDLDAVVLENIGGSTAIVAPLASDGLAYVAYAGEPGRLRGIEFTHDSLAGMADWQRRRFGITPLDRASQSATPGSCEALWEMWPYLSAGASVHFPGERVRRDPALLRRWIAREGITAAFSAGAIANWIGDGPRFVLTPHRTQGPAPVSGPVTVETFGPPECLSMALCGGAPAFGSRVYVLDPTLRPAGEGCEGELCVAGPSVARGYRNAPGLTAVKFGRDPVAADGARFFRTGHRARMLEGGRIALLNAAEAGWRN